MRSELYMSFNSVVNKNISLATTIILLPIPLILCHIDQCDLNLIYNALVLIGFHLMFGVSESIFYVAHL